MLTEQERRVGAMKESGHGVCASYGGVEFPVGDTDDQLPGLGRVDESH